MHIGSPPPLTPFGFPVGPQKTTNVGAPGVPSVELKPNDDSFKGSTGPFGTLAKLRSNAEPVSNLLYKRQFGSPAGAMTLRLLSEELAHGKNADENRPLRRFFQDGLQNLATVNPDRAKHILLGLVLHCAENDRCSNKWSKKKCSNKWITDNVFIPDRSGNLPGWLAHDLALKVKEVSGSRHGGILGTSLEAHLKATTDQLPNPSSAELQHLANGLLTGKAPRQTQAVLASLSDNDKAAVAKYVEEAKAVANATRDAAPDPLRSFSKFLKAAINSKPSAAKQKSPVDPATGHTGGGHNPLKDRTPAKFRLLSNVPNPEPSLLLKKMAYPFALYGKEMTPPGMRMPTSGRAFQMPIPPPAQPGHVEPPPRRGPPLSEDRRKLMGDTSAEWVQMLAPLPRPTSDGTHEMIGAVLDGNGLHEHAEKLFKTAQPSQLATLMRALEEPPAATPGRSSFALTHEFLVLESLAHATNGDAGRAFEALRGLRSGAFLPRKDSDNLAAQGAPTPQAALDALDAAGHLASWPKGFDALMAQMKPAPDEVRQPHVRRLLEAAVQLRAEREKTGNTEKQVDINRLAPAGDSSSLAHRVLEFEVAALKREDMSFPLTRQEKIDLYTWRNGFHSEGPGTDLNEVQKRVAKVFFKHVKRAELFDKREKAIIQWNDPASWTKYVAAKGANAITQGRQAIGTLKSPFTALIANGTMGAQLMHPDIDAANLDANTHTVISELLKHLDKQIADLPDHGAIKPGDLYNAKKDLPKEVERAAILKYWESLLTDFRPLGHVLDDTSIEKVAEHIAERYEIGTKDLHALEAKLSSWKGHELSLQDLQKWVDDSKLPTHDGPDAKGEETKCSEALRVARGIYERTQRPTEVSSAGLRQFIAQFFKEENLGNSATVANGGLHGVSTAAISSLFHGLASVVATATGVLVSVSPNLDLRGTGGRLAIVSLGSTTHGFELGFGTQKPWLASLSAGASVGVAVLGWIKAAAGLQGREAREGAESSVVVFRSPRFLTSDGEKYDTLDSRNGMVEATHVLFDVIDKHQGEKDGPDPSKVWEDLAEKLYDSTVTVSLQRQGAESALGSVTGHARAGIFAPAPGKDWHATNIGNVGGGLTKAATWSQKKTTDHSVIRVNRGGQSLTTATVSGSVGGGSQPVEERGSHGIPAAIAGSETHAVGSRKGFTVNLRTIKGEDRRLSEYFTLLDLEERDPDRYLQFLEERRDQMISLFSARFGPEAGSDEYENFKVKVKNWSGANERHYIRYRITDQARDLLEDCMAIAGAIESRQPADPLLQQIANVMHDTLQNEDSWIPTEVFSMARERVKTLKGANVVQLLRREESTEADRETKFVAVGPKTSSRWTKEGLQRDPVADEQAGSKGRESSPWHGFSVPPSPDNNSTPGSRKTPPLSQPSAVHGEGIAETFKLEARPKEAAGGLGKAVLEVHVLQTVLNPETGYSHFEGVTRQRNSDNPFASVPDRNWLANTPPASTPSTPGTRFFTTSASPTGSPRHIGGGGQSGVDPHELARRLRELPTNAGDQRRPEIPGL